MSTVKLTLSADGTVIAKAKRLAAARHTSVSALFGRLLGSLAASGEESPVASLGPITRRASGIIRMPKDRTARQLLTEALSDRYGRRR